MADQPTQAIEVFCSYSHRDEDLRKELDKHIKILERRGVIAVWNDRKIEPGEEWNGEIDKHLESADVILLLISADFIASDFCYGIEMTRALERHDAGEACVIPIFIRPVNWKGAPFGKLQALPTDAKPVTSWSDHDEAFVIVSEGIQRAVESLIANRRIHTTATGGTDTRPTSPFIPRSPVFGFVRRRDTDGRDIVERLKETLAPGKNNLVTLSGPGGIGKTTLAAEGARSLEAEFGSRIIWSSAEKRSDFTLATLLDDIATQTNNVNLRTLAPEAKEAAVRTLVADPPTVVVLDNCETITTAEQKRIEEWFVTAPCSALFTSRPQINVTLNIRVAAMSQEEAREFLQKLVGQTQDPEIFSDEVRQRIYETADANPYVMQWVIAQIDMAQQPNAVLEDLAHGKGDAAQRVFDRSFNLPRLGDDGRATLLALSLFVPSASRSALAEVAGFDNDEERVKEAIKNLRALWLIKGIAENSRFTIEGLTRSLTKSRLAKEASADDFRRRFIAHFLPYAEAHAKPTPEDFAALEAEKDNILSAMDVAFNLKDLLSVTRLMDVVGRLLRMRGYWDEAIRRGQQSLESAQELGDEAGVAIFAHNMAITFQSRGELEEARRLYNVSLDINKKLSNQRGIADTLNNLALIAQDRGELKEAWQLYNDSIDINRKVGNQSGIAVTLHQLATLAQEQGELEKARQLYNESLDIEKTLSNQSGISGTLHNLAVIAQAQGEPEEARRLYNESLIITERLGDQSGISITLHELGRLAHVQGELEEAQRFYNESLGIKKTLGDQRGIAITLQALATLAWQQRELIHATRLFREALSIFEKLGSPYAERVREDLKRLEDESS
ncbi:MAG TPA: tetratricopeptide repeat protein [Pyrinomonadaceae bacterium]|nr:tetratricopeptide repeat protein [Pyrinomonadaceae bacterium]